MKKSLFILLVVAMVLISAMPAFAAGTNASKQSTQFTLTGRIVAIEGSVVTVNVSAGKPIVRPYIGQALQIQTTNATRFLLKTETGAVSISLADLTVDQNVSVQGQVVNGVWTAARITVGAAVIHR